MIISRRAVDDYLSRDFDNFNWIKETPRADLIEELRSFKVRPVFRRDPWTHQLACFLLGMTFPQFFFLLDMGLGKSKIISDLFFQRLREKKVTRGLITVPRQINVASWADDLDANTDLGYTLVNESEIEAKIELLLNPTGDLTIIDYMGLHLALSKKEGKRGKRRMVKDEKLIRKVQRIYPFIGMDECHKLGNHDSLWFSIMRDLTKHADYVYGTTGTMFGRDPEAVWAQYFLLDRGETFGANLGIFRAAFFESKTHPWKGQTFIPLKSMTRQFNRMVNHRSIQYEDVEVPETELPPCVDLVDRIYLGDEQREAYTRIVDGVINADGDATQMEPGAWIKLRQIASGYLKWKDSSGDHLIRFAYNPKMEAMLRRIEQAAGSKVVISTEYTETGEMIMTALKTQGYKARWLYGGAKDPMDIRRAFLDDPNLQVLVINSASGGTGLDGLQKVSRYLIMYEEPPSPTDYKQLRKRIYRSGQRRRAFIISLRAVATVDMSIATSRQEGIDLYDQMIKGKGIKPSRRLLFGGGQ